MNLETKYYTVAAGAIVVGVAFILVGVLGTYPSRGVVALLGLIVAVCGLLLIVVGVVRRRRN